MQVEKTIADDKTITLKITVPWKTVEEARTKVVDTLVKEVTAPGFRKGTAPRNIAEQYLKKEVVQEEVLKEVLGKSYNEAVKAQNITPIITPRVHVETFEDGTDLVFSAEVCEAPEVTLGDYKSEVAKVTAKTKIAVPGKEEVKPNVNEVLEAVSASSKVEIPKVLYEQEAQRLLSQTLDELKSLGLTLDQYLNSRGKTADDMKTEAESRAKSDLAIEFTLRKIADTENITVEKADIDEALAGIQDENQKQQLLQNPYFLASIIRQQKTLDFLAKI